MTQQFISKVHVKEEVAKNLYPEDRIGNELYMIKFVPIVDINCKFSFSNPVEDTLSTKSQFLILDCDN